MRDFAWFLVLIPRNIGVLLIRGYRTLISPLYGDVCRYYPSCSAYGLGSVQQRGLVAGSVLTAWRILRCNPWSAGGIDDVRAARHDRYRVTAFGWVVPAGWLPAGPASPAHAAAASGAGAVAHQREHGHGDHDHAEPARPRRRAAASAARIDAGHTLSPTVSRKD